MGVLAILGLMVAGAAALGLVYQAIGTWRDARRIRPPGTMVAVGRTRYHVNVTGSGGPVVVLEAGIAASSLSWAIVQRELAQCTTVLSYDRGGLGWSDRVRAPRTPGRLAEELHALLAALALPPPYVLVGHSFGGLVVRAFAATYPRETAALVFCDALHPGEWSHPTPHQRRMVAGGVLFSRIGALLATFGVVRFALAMLSRGRATAGKAVLGAFGKGATTVVSRIVGEVAKIPPELRPLMRAQWSRPKAFLGMAAYLKTLRESSLEIAAAAPLSEFPLVVLSAGRNDPPAMERQRELAQLCPGGRHLVLPECGHWVQLDAPSEVARAVRELVEQCRDKP